MIESYEFFLNTKTEYIDYINKIMEAYEGLGIVRTLDPKAGKVKIITLKHYREEVLAIILNLKKDNITIDIEKEGVWEGIL